MKHILIGILVMGAGLGSLVQGQVFLEQPADVVIYKDKGKTYARVTERRLAGLLKIGLDETISSADEGLSDVEVIQKAVNTVYKAYSAVSDGGKSEPTLIKILLKKGVYNLTQTGLKIPHSWPFVIEGEDRKNTILEYSGDGIALGFDKEDVEKQHASSSCVFEVRKLTIKITGNAEAAIWSIKIENDIFEDLTITASEDARPKRGLWIVGGEGHLRFVRNVSIIGPFQVGIDAPAGWFTIFDAKIRGFREYGIRSGGKIFLVDIFTKCPQAKAGVAVIGGEIGAGTYRCMERMAFFKTEYQRDEYIRQTWQTPCINVSDHSPFMTNYTPFFLQDEYLCLAGCKSRSYRDQVFAKGQGRYSVFPKNLLNLLPNLRTVAEITSRPEPEIDIIVYKDLKDQTCAQIVSEELAKKAGVQCGHMIVGAEDIVQNCIDMLPKRGKIYFKQGIYKAGKLEIPWDREITIEGHSFAQAYSNLGSTLRTEGISFKGIRNTRRFPYFCVKNIRLEGGEVGLKLENLQPVIRNVKIPKFSKIGILIKRCKNALIMNSRIQYGGPIDIEDEGEGTVVMSCWLGNTVKIGPQGRLLGPCQAWGGIYTNFGSIPEEIDDGWRRKNSSLIIGHQVEGIPPYFANTFNLYLFGCGRDRMGGPAAKFEETNGGRIVIVK